MPPARQPDPPALPHSGGGDPPAADAREYHPIPGQVEPERLLADRDPNPPLPAANVSKFHLYLLTGATQRAGRQRTFVLRRSRS